MGETIHNSRSWNKTHVLHKEQFLQFKYMHPQPDNLPAICSMNEHQIHNFRYAHTGMCHVISAGVLGCVTDFEGIQDCNTRCVPIFLLQAGQVCSTSLHLFIKKGTKKHPNMPPKQHIPAQVAHVPCPTLWLATVVISAWHSGQ